MEMKLTKTSPIQAGLKWITKTETNFYGSNLIKEDIENGCKYMIIGIKSEERMIPRNGDIIFNSDKNENRKNYIRNFFPNFKKTNWNRFYFKRQTKL